MEPEVVVRVDFRSLSRFVTNFGEIHVIQEITIGDLLVVTSVTALIIVVLISQVYQWLRSDCMYEVGDVSKADILSIYVIYSSAAVVLYAFSKLNFGALAKGAEKWE